MNYSEKDKLKALAIVHVFETSRPFGDYAACVVLNDGAGVSYGINQFTHRSGSLAAVVETYLKSGGQIGKEVFADVLPVLKKKLVAAINGLAADERFKKTLRAAAITSEMKATQKKVAFEKYLLPALTICERMGFVMPLSLAVVYDSVTHGSWEWISARVGRRAGFLPLSIQSNETAWITEYVRKRHQWLTEVKRLRVTNYRTKFFLAQIAIGNWSLRLPMTVHGTRLTEATFAGVDVAVADVDGDAAVGSEPEVAGAVSPTIEPSVEETNVLESAGDAIATAAGKFDRLDGVVTAVSLRKDAAKSLWTTVIGTIWQTAWAVFGFLIGLPKEVWIVVAVIAGALMLFYLYRQIELGRIRENLKSGI